MDPLFLLLNLPPSRQPDICTPVLIVDDDDAMRETLAQALVRAGYLVLQCTDGSHVLKVLEKQHVDLLITDLFMEETDGLATIMKVRKERPEMKIIAMSGGGSLTDNDYLPIASRLGAHRTLHKPFNAAVLLETIHRLLPPPGNIDSSG